MFPYANISTKYTKKENKSFVNEENKVSSSMIHLKINEFCKNTFNIIQQSINCSKRWQKTILISPKSNKNAMMIIYKRIKIL